MTRRSSRAQPVVAPPGLRSRIALAIGKRFFVGWLMLAISALAYFASGPAQSHIFSVFITPLSNDLGVSRTELSSAYAFATLGAAFGLPYLGRLIDRHGVRLVLIAITVLFTLAQCGFSQVQSVIALTIGFASLRFFGQGSLMLSSANLVSQWFDRKRGFALSLMSLGFAASMAVHPPLAQSLIDAVGWRDAWLWLAAATAVLLLPAVVVLVHNRPEDLGLRPDGAPGTPTRIEAATTIDTIAGLSLRDAMRTQAFWIIAAALGSLSMLVTAIFFHQVSILDTQGVTTHTATRVFAVSALTMVGFMPIFGRALDRFRTQNLFACAMVMMAFTLVALAFVVGTSSAIVYAVLFGLTNAALHTNNAYMWPRFFGRRHLGAIQGAGTTINVVGASIGPIPLGIAFDTVGHYQGMLFGLAVIPALLALAVLKIRAPSLTQ